MIRRDTRDRAIRLLVQANRAGQRCPSSPEEQAELQFPGFEERKKVTAGIHHFVGPEADNLILLFRNGAQHAFSFVVREGDFRMIGEKQKVLLPPVQSAQKFVSFFILCQRRILTPAFLTDAVIIAVIYDARSCEQMVEYAAAKPEWRRKYLPFTNGVPGASTFRNVLSRMNPDKVHAMFIE